MVGVAREELIPNDVSIYELPAHWRGRTTRDIEYL